jgi:hypothetical protein
MAKKVSIDYLQFLNMPELDSESKVWFFTYMEPIKETIKRISKPNEYLIESEWKKIQHQLIELQKKRDVKIKTNTIINTQKKKITIHKKETIVKNKLAINEYITKALELKIQGFDKKAIQVQLINTYKISPSKAGEASTACYEYLSRDVDEDFIRFTVMNHSNYYDEFYRKLSNLNAPKLAMRALKVKEQLNGIGQDIFEIQVNNVFEDQKDLVTYGLKKLNEEEQKEFVTILSRIQAVNHEKQKQLK